jgi:hypothetical protein
MNERREYDRIAINFPVIYVASDSNGQIETQGLGLALDISMDGMMFESNEPVDATTLSIHASYSDGKTIKINAFLVYSMPYADGRYRSGIRFSGTMDEISNFVTAISNLPI